VLNLNGDVGYLNATVIDWKVDDEPNVQLYYVIGNLASPEPRIVSAACNVLRLFSPTWWLMKMSEKGLMTITGMRTRRNEGNNNM
jgi:hypothetical protein